MMISQHVKDDGKSDDYQYICSTWLDVPIRLRISHSQTVGRAQARLSGNSVCH